MSLSEAILNPDITARQEGVTGDPGCDLGDLSAVYGFSSSCFCLLLLFVLVARECKHRLFQFNDARFDYVTKQ